MTVTITHEGEIGIVTIDNPPVSPHLPDVVASIP